MPRRARVVEVNVPLHIRQRGNNRQMCFQREVDYIVYRRWLAEYARASGCEVHAYVLMTNHVHILASFNDVTGPALLMKGLAQRYSQYFNWWYKRTGTVWEGRYRSSLVLDERYFLTCQRYVELNPVRAGMVAIPGQYRWSSYRGNAGMWEDETLTSHLCYQSLGATAAAQQAAYRSLFETELEPSLVEEIRTATRANAPLGGPPVKRGRPKKR